MFGFGLRLPLRFASRTLFMQQIMNRTKFSPPVTRNYHNGNNNGPKPASDATFLFSAGFISNVMIKLGLQKDEEEGDPLTMLVKKGIYAFRLGQYPKAEKLLHDALNMAKEQNHDTGVDYILNVLADHAMETQQFEKAEPIFKELLTRMLSKGYREDDEAVIEISLHLATIYSSNREYEKAEEGFAFCIKHQTERIKGIPLDDPSSLTAEQKNSLALYSMVCDYFAKYCLRRRDYKLSLKYTEEAHKFAQIAAEEDDDMVMTLTNDLGVINDILGNANAAEKFFLKAIDLATDNGSDQLAVFYYNLGMLYFKMGETTKAILACQNTHRLTVLNGPKSLQIKATRCVRRATGDIPTVGIS